MSDKPLDLQKLPTFGINYPKEMMPKEMRAKIHEMLWHRRLLEARTIWIQIDLFYKDEI